MRGGDHDRRRDQGAAAGVAIEIVAGVQEVVDVEGHLPGVLLDGRRCPADDPGVVRRRPGRRRRAPRPLPPRRRRSIARDEPIRPRAVAQARDRERLGTVLERLPPGDQAVAEGEHRRHLVLVGVLLVVAPPPLLAIQGHQVRAVGVAEHLLQHQPLVEPALGDLGRPGARLLAALPQAARRLQLHLGVKSGDERVQVLLVEGVVETSDQGGVIAHTRRLNGGAPPLRPSGSAIAVLPARPPAPPRPPRAPRSRRDGR